MYVAQLPRFEFDVKYRPLNSSQTDKISVFAVSADLQNSDQRDESAILQHGQQATGGSHCWLYAPEPETFPVNITSKVLIMCHEFTGEIKLSLYINMMRHVC